MGYSTFLVIINNLDLEGISTPPHKAHPVLIVNADAMLPFAIAVKPLQSVPWRHPQVLERDRGVQKGEFYECSSL